MASSPRQMHLNYFHYPTGHHESAWRLPESDSAYACTAAYHVATAKIAEAACFDSIFLAHTSAAMALGNTNIALMWDPALILATMGAHTQHIGLIGTMSTSFIAPYDLAQKFRTLDQLTDGRAGWNIITSSTDGEAQNFNMEHMPSSEERYRRADEFVELCNKLWESWEPDAMVMDKETGVFADMAKVHAVDHRGPSFSVKGPLHLPSSPQRRPLLVQAGSSEQGRDFAAKHADAIFTIQPLLEDAIAFYAEMQKRFAQHGRPERAARILPGLAPVLGATEAEARRNYAELSALVLPEKGLEMLKSWLGMDFSSLPLDGPVPPLADASTYDHVSRAKVVIDFVARNNPTLRELAAMIAGGRGHHVFVGTAEQLADEMETWVAQGAADGFNVMPLLLPRGLVDFAHQVIPILQDRGLFRTEYEPGTLRERYGATTAVAVGA